MSFDYRDARTGEELYVETLEERFNDFIDEVYDEVVIGYATFPPSAVLLEMDPAAWQESFDNWVDAALEDGDLIDLEYEDEYEDDEEEW